MSISNNARLYVAVCGEGVTIYHRPTYQYITSCTKKEVKSILTKMLSMSTEEFYRYLLLDKNVRIRTDIDITAKNLENKEREDWYRGAWSQVTAKLFKELKLTMVEEEMPLALVKVIMKEEADKRAKAIRKVNPQINISVIDDEILIESNCEYNENEDGIDIDLELDIDDSMIEAMLANAYK